MFEEFATTAAAFAKRLGDLRTALDIDKANADIEALEARMSYQGFWDNPEEAQRVMQELKGLKQIASAPDQLQTDIADLQELIELAQLEEDPSMEAEIREMMDALRLRLDRIELSSLLNDPRDHKPALLNIHPGAGGTESCDWAEMLYRMITRWCERNEYDYEVLDYLPGEEAGLKSASIRVTGPNAFGMLKSESGVHRLVRISPFDSAKRRHTSFSAVEVLSEIDDDIVIEVRDEDIKMDVFRSSGAGGQKVNKTSSAVRLTHQPTGIVVACQMERSQHQNREVALNMLKSKLYDIELKKQEAELAAQREGQQDVAWGSQIRSYVLAPYQMIKDHRTGHETGSTDAVLDGALDEFISAYLKWKLGQKAQARADA